MSEADRLPEADRREGCPHPRETFRLVGHAAAERALGSAFRSGRMHHAWLITGPEGVGKATLAYRMARYALANPRAGEGQASLPPSPLWGGAGGGGGSERGEDADAAPRSALALLPEPPPPLPSPQGGGGGSAALSEDIVPPVADDLFVPENHPAARKVAQLSHPDMLVLRRGWNADRKTHYGEIRVDDVRRATQFFGSTAGEGGWRVAIVDAADDLNGAAANALLKALEEPPPRAIFLLLSATPRGLPAPVRSRCRTLALQPLASAEVAEVLQGLPEIAEAHDGDAIAEAAALADGSVARALSLLASDGASLRQTVTGLLDRLPAIDVKASHGLAEDLAKRGAEERFSLFVGLVGDWLHERVRAGAAVREPDLARYADAWEKTARAAREVEIYNLDRRPFVLGALSELAELARG